MREKKNKVQNKLIEFVKHKFPELLPKEKDEKIMNPSVRPNKPKPTSN